MMKIAIIMPRYGPNIAGGAETLGRGLAEAAAAYGWQVEAWTTCVQNHYTWQNELPAGEELVNGVLVRRFPVVKCQEARQADLESRLALQGLLSPDEQYLWLEGGPQSPSLYQYVQRQAAAFDALIILPYANPMMQAAAWVCPEKTIFIPCIHPEPYAYMQPFHLLMETVYGVLFNAPEGARLATGQLHINPRRHAVLGAGVTQPHTTSTPPDDMPVPYLYYIGRLEEGKNLTLLYRAVQHYYDKGHSIRLVVSGKGPYIPPQHPAFDYRGYVTEAEKRALCAGALAVCQPSINESFSVAIMESWLEGRPVLVHADGQVTRGHVQRSKGGLWFATDEELAAAVEWLQAHPQEAAQMGRNGQAYVRQNYTWPALIQRFSQIWQSWTRGV